MKCFQCDGIVDKPKAYCLYEMEPVGGADVNIYIKSPNPCFFCSLSCLIMAAEHETGDDLDRKEDG